MMSLKHIGATASALGNQVGGGIPLDQAVNRMAQMQPDRSEFWLRAVQEIRAGRPLSASLAEVWPEALVSAVVAGEQSGRIEEVLQRINDTIEIQLTLRKAMNQLVYPIAMAIGGVVVFLVFMIVVIPLLAKVLAGTSGSHGQESLIFQLSTWLAATVKENYLTLGAVVVGGAYALWAWLQTPKAKEDIMAFLLGIPVVKEALRDMFFGLWARYMAIMVSAGIPTISALSLTAPVLPTTLRESVELFERDLAYNNKTMSESADKAQLPDTDPRARWWPIYISNAFIVAEQTGDIDRELLRAAPSLIKEGVARLEFVIMVATGVTMAVAGILIVSPLAAFYSQLFATIRSVG